MAGRPVLTSSLVLLFLVTADAGARVLNVPEFFATIGDAISASESGDSILVNRGVYPEQLWFPPHRIVVMSNYELSGDTLDMVQTVIEGYSYADRDTATIALFLDGTADGCKLCGFTLRGGHGIGPGGFSGAFMADSCSPVICHNRITDNSSSSSPVGNFYYSSGQFLHNRVFDNAFSHEGLRVYFNIGQDPVLIEGNFFGPNPSSASAAIPGIFVYEHTAATIRSNTFRGLTGRVDLAISHHGRNPVIINNVFDSLSVTGEICSIVWLYGTQDVNLCDNVFSNIRSADAVVAVLDGRNRFGIIAQGNVFEHNAGFMAGEEPVSAGLWVEGYNGIISNNIFRSNRAVASGGIYIAGAAFPDPRGLDIRFNLFESCSTSSPNPESAACVFRGGYDGPVVSRHNLFNHNFPRVVTRDATVPGRIADFRENWWGHESGPYHPELNPAGLGDPVGDSVLFDPWHTDSLIDGTDGPPAWIPRVTKLVSCPNPFNSTARLFLSVDTPGTYAVRLYSITGRLESELWRGAVVIGREISVSAEELASGVYFATADHLETNRRSATAKLVIIK